MHIFHPLFHVNNQTLSLLISKQWKYPQTFKHHYRIYIYTLYLALSKLLHYHNRIISHRGLLNSMTIDQYMHQNLLAFDKTLDSNLYIQDRKNSPIALLKSQLNSTSIKKILKFYLIDQR